MPYKNRACPVFLCLVLFFGEKLEKKTYKIKIKIQKFLVFHVAGGEGGRG